MLQRDKATDSHEPRERTYVLYIQPVYAHLLYSCPWLSNFLPPLKVVSLYDVFTPAEDYRDFEDV